MGEFELIDAIVAELGTAAASPEIEVGPGDDAAVMTLPAGHALVTSVDTLVSDVHFPAAAPAAFIAQRALRVSVSDLAAMGARPLSAVVALVLPVTSEVQWVKDLSQGFAAAATALGCPVVGGNLAQGELSISVTVQGVVPAGQALLRSGAQAGDDVWVSGPLGGACVALQRDTALGLGRLASDAALLDEAQRQYFLPQPQLALGEFLRGVATSAIDVSDGFVADLDHIARASRIDVDLLGAAIPRLAGASLEQALFGGDDYQLCFTAPPEARSAIQKHAPQAKAVGQCLARAEPERTESRVRLDGRSIEARGFDHFSSSRPTGESA